MEKVCNLCMTKAKHKYLEIKLENDIEEDNKELPILRLEIRKWRRKNRFDELPIDFFKGLNEESLEEIVFMCNKMYNHGVLLDDFTNWQSTL